MGHIDLFDFCSRYFYTSRRGNVHSLQRGINAKYVGLVIYIKLANKLMNTALRI